MFERFLARLAKSDYREKVETVLSRGIFNTRPRDYYDIFILATTQKYDRAIWKEALKATAEYRGSSARIFDTDTVFDAIFNSDELMELWRKYQKKFAYAKDISYEDVIGRSEIYCEYVRQQSYTAAT
jgi:hypothetical protein